jgi:hypothetical protein
MMFWISIGRGIPGRDYKAFHSQYKPVRLLKFAASSILGVTQVIPQHGQSALRRTKTKLVRKRLLHYQLAGHIVMVRPADNAANNLVFAPGR